MAVVDGPERGHAGAEFRVYWLAKVSLHGRVGLKGLYGRVCLFFIGDTQQNQYAIILYK